jgi:dTDP-4-dehydrorhamnose 3,5-epimerase-like enzyme
MNPTGPISTIDAPPQKRPRIEQDVEQDVEEDKVNALIYEWRLDRIDPEHSLFGTSYFGQVVRNGLTHEEAFHVRKQEHISNATREPKDLGLHWAITTFGVEAFSVESLEKELLPRTQARNWANERERTLIDENGGVMRDCEPRVNIQQTFNLTLGGQGDPQKMWLGIQASSRKKLKRVWPKFEAYYEKHGHLRVPQTDPDLGRTVNCIRSQKDFLWHADFKAWLDERGFVYDARAWHVEEEVWPKFKAYYEKHGHLRVPQTDPDLGSTVNNIRSRKDFLWHADFKAWLREHGFVYDARAWHVEEEVWPKFKAYYERHGHLRVPQTDPDLGGIVKCIRSRKDFLWHADFKAWLREHGFKMHARNDRKSAERWAEVL